MAYEDGVTIITCTGDRPKALELCAKFVCRQVFHGNLQWITANDGRLWDDEGRLHGVAMTPEWGGLYSAKRSDRDWTQLFPEPRWQPGQNTLARNLLAAIPRVKYDKVLFFEDDDYVAPDYIARMLPFLEGRDLVGDPVSRYYNIPKRLWRVMKNDSMASLCQTGMRATLLPLLADVCSAGPNLIDFRLWRHARNRYLGEIGCVVGMKGLPGRPGIGIGHYPERQAAEWTADPNCERLESWIGADIELYREFL